MDLNNDEEYLMKSGVISNKFKKKINSKINQFIYRVKLDKSSNKQVSNPSIGIIKDPLRNVSKVSGRNLSTHVDSVAPGQKVVNLTYGGTTEANPLQPQNNNQNNDNNSNTVNNPINQINPINPPIPGTNPVLPKIPIMNPGIPIPPMSNIMNPQLLVPNGQNPGLYLNDKSQEIPSVNNPLNPKDNPITPSNNTQNPPDNPNLATMKPMNQFPIFPPISIMNPQLNPNAQSTEFDKNKFPNQNITQFPNPLIKLPGGVNPQMIPPYGAMPFHSQFPGSPMMNQMMNQMIPGLRPQVFQQFPPNVPVVGPVPQNPQPTVQPPAQENETQPSNNSQNTINQLSTILTNIIKNEGSKDPRIRKKK